MISEIINILSRDEHKALEKIEIFTAEDWKWELIELIKNKGNIGKPLKQQCQKEFRRMQRTLI